ncbi:MAG TPA: DUF5615 family PIN-like protein [Planctomycetaceae bacterium]|nr:DUF5615 family PIN-like protein [Planctomycetaceae bacterium]
MARLYADEHIPPQVVARLRRLGHEVATVRSTAESKSGDGTGVHFNCHMHANTGWQF